MDRSHVAPLLVAVFAILVLGVAAGSLNNATPAGKHVTGSSAGPGEGGGGGSGASADSSSSSDQTISHVLFSDLDVADGVDERPSQPSRSVGVFLLGTGLLLVGIVALVLHLTGNDDRAPSDQDSEPEFPKPERSRPPIVVANAPLSNDVYRAWRRMVESVGANVAAEETPAELARKVTSAGLPPQPVDELTELFCAIRYGPTHPTKDREEQARNALEQILRAIPIEDSEALSSDPDT